MCVVKRIATTTISTPVLIIARERKPLYMPPINLLVSLLQLPFVLKPIATMITPSPIPSLAREPKRLNTPPIRLLSFVFPLLLPQR